MPTNEQELKDSISQNMRQFAARLIDSPISFRTHADWNFGFYVGFCSAKNWEVDTAFLKRIDGPQKDWV